MFYFYNRKMDEDSAEKFVQKYVNQINGYNHDNDSLNNYFPQDYISKNVNNVGTIVQYYSSKSQQEITSLWKENLNH